MRCIDDRDCRHKILKRDVGTVGSAASLVDLAAGCSRGPGSGEAASGSLVDNCVHTHKAVIHDREAAHNSLMWDVGMAPSLAP